MNCLTAEQASIRSRYTVSRYRGLCTLFSSGHGPLYGIKLVSDCLPLLPVSKVLLLVYGAPPGTIAHLHLAPRHLVSPRLSRKGHMQPNHEDHPFSGAERGAFWASKKLTFPPAYQSGSFHDGVSSSRREPACLCSLPRVLFSLGVFPDLKQHLIVSRYTCGSRWALA